MRLMCHYFKGYYVSSILGPLFKLFEALLELAVPLIVANIIDVVVIQKQQENLVMYGGMLVLIAILGVIFANSAQYFSANAAIGYTRQLSQSLFRKTLSLTKVQQDQLGISSIVTRLSSDTAQVQTGLNLFFRLFLRSPFIVFGAAAMAFGISRSLTLLFAVMIMILFALVAMVMTQTTPMYSLVRQEMDKLVHYTRQQMLGMRVIRAFRQTHDEIKEFQTQNTRYTHTILRVNTFANFLNPITYVIVNVTLIILIYMGALRIQVGDLTQGELIALTNYLLQILAELLKLAMLINTLNKSWISANRVATILSMESQTVPSTFIQSDEQSRITVTDLTFYYENAKRPAIDKISFEIKKGDTFGIIGGTGSGKSTLLHLLTQVYEPTSGHIAHAVSTIPNHVGDVMSIVPQKVELFQGTIRSNLTLGFESEISDERLWKALDTAQASEFVREKTLALDEPVKAFGKNFSGGQRQRLSIARALVRHTDVLILDDATSALDFKTESELFKALNQNYPHLTIILVTQRTNALLHAHNILLLNNGKQIGLGNHHALLETNALYQEIYYSQHHHDTKYQMKHDDATIEVANALGGNDHD